MSMHQLSFPDWRWLKASPSAATRLNRLFAVASLREFKEFGQTNIKSNNQKKGSIFCRAPYNSSVSAYFVRKFVNASFDTPSGSPFELASDKDPSLQAFLIQGLSAGKKSVWRNQVIKAGGAKFIAVVDSALGRFSLEKGLEDAAWKAIFFDFEAEKPYLYNPRVDANPFWRRKADVCIVANPPCWLFEAIYESMRDSLKESVCELFNAYRSTKDKINVLDQTIAKNWLNPDCPLWLMSPRALLTACNVMSGGEAAWTSSQVRASLNKLQLSLDFQIIEKVETQTGPGQRPLIYLFRVKREAFYKAKSAFELSNNVGARPLEFSSVLGLKELFYSIKKINTPSKDQWHPTPQRKGFLQLH